MRKNWYKWNTANNMKPKTRAHTSFVHSPLRLLAYCKPFQIRFSIHSCSGWENCNGHSASRGSSAVAEFLVETLGSSRRMRKGLFTAHELSWPDLHQDDPVITRRVHWSRASAKLGQLGAQSVPNTCIPMRLLTVRLNAFVLLGHAHSCHSQYSQPYSLGGGSDAASGYQPTTVTTHLPQTYRSSYVSCY